MGKDISLLEEVSIKFTEETLKNILIKVTKKKTAEVSGWKFESRSSKGDNYLSIIYRATIDGIVDGKNTSIKTIIKGMPHNETTKKIFPIAEFFRNEINFYNKVIPEFEKFIESKQQNYTLPIPKCLEYFCDGNNDYIVLEDVRELGYAHIPRHDIWILEELQAIFNSLARIHAISFAFKDQYPLKFIEIAKTLNKTYFREENWGWYEKMFTDVVNVAKDSISQEYKNTPEEQKFSSLSVRGLWKKATSRVSTELTPTSLVNQGDSWPGNCMVHMTQTEKREALLLDFQLASCDSHIIDISYFLYTSTDKEIRDKHFNNLLKYYHDQFSNYISLLGSNPQKMYSWDLFMKEVKDKFIIGFCLALGCLPVMMLDESETFDIENVSGTKDMDAADIIKIKPIRSKEKRRRLADSIVHAIQLGFL